MPTLERELQPVKDIVEELRILASRLAEFPSAQGGGATRTADPARSIVASLKKINSTLEDASRRGSLGPAGFTAIGQEFEKIGKTLLSLGSGSTKKK